MNIYLDFDGVILANDLQPANNANEFLKYITDWNISKTEAIDFKTPFLWFEDRIFDI